MTRHTKRLRELPPSPEPPSAKRLRGATVPTSNSHPTRGYHEQAGTPHQAAIPRTLMSEASSISSWAFDDIPEDPVAPTTRPFLARLVRKISEHRTTERERREAPPEVLTRTLHGEHLVQRRLRR